SIDAMPTKELFIDMLTRDIELIPAILDLVDNSVDGARRLKGNGSYKDFQVRLETSPDQLRMVDNCGGIDVDLARKYAFRFGKPGNAPVLAHSIGKFGVGMKRAFFKLGQVFEIESKAKNSSFTLKVDVVKWARDESKWEFRFDRVQEGLKTISKDKRGTAIRVTKLRTEVAAEFKLSSFERNLDGALATHLQDALTRGLTITLNQIPIEQKPLELLDHSKLLPAFKKVTYRHRNEKPVVVKLYCGLGPGREAREMA
ncbi:unnamed protein product, partial [marine sediment metagenome]